MILTPEEMKKCDEATCRKKGISTLELMEQVGKELFHCFLDEFKPNKKQMITIVSGLGHNGGDGLVMAEHLLKEDYNVSVVVVGNENKLTRDSLVILQRLNAPVLYVHNQEHLPAFEKILASSKLIIDGIFGIGLNRIIKGIFYEVIRIINQYNACVFSIDIPSGINGKNGNIAGTAVEADLTAIVQNYKIGNLLNDAKDYHGKIIVLDVDINQDLSIKRFLVDNEKVKLRKKRKHNTHKYHYGSVLTFAGAMTGAALQNLSIPTQNYLIGRFCPKGITPLI